MHIYGHHILFYVQVAATLGICAFGLWKGDAAVRYASATNLAVELATLAIMPKVGDSGGESILLAVDFAFAVTLLFLAVRFANLWIGAAMMLQAAQFSLHAYYLVMDLPHDRLHAWINNTDNWGTLISFFVGTILAMRRRRDLADEAAEREALRERRALRPDRISRLP
jgi:hypothetical protein